MFPLSIHPFAHRCCRLHSRLLTIASNYPHFFFFFFYTADEILTQPCLSCVRLCREAETERKRKGDSHGEEKR